MEGLGAGSKGQGERMRDEGGRKKGEAKFFNWRGDPSVTLGMIKGGREQGDNLQTFQRLKVLEVLE